MIKIMTIDRKYGSGAADIAATLAARLGWKLWDELLISEIARILGCDCPAVEEREERRDALHYRLFKAFLRGSFEGTLNAQRVKMVDADCIREASRAPGGWTRQWRNRRTWLGRLSSFQPGCFSRVRLCAV